MSGYEIPDAHVALAVAEQRRLGLPVCPLTTDADTTAAAESPSTDAQYERLVEDLERRLTAAEASNQNLMAALIGAGDAEVRWDRKLDELGRRQDQMVKALDQLARAARLHVTPPPARSWWRRAFTGGGIR
ncbi:hypothetical protein [Pilimelia columellifera]|uniref:Uncharacterized protein n=1 Tax=Pilimelia columellifera subsp. columellifera TaxID=706583 RepID=A0ABP6B1U7_9ACTN